MLKILIASANPGKLREIQAVLGGHPYELYLPTQVGQQREVHETGSTYAENAALKALAYTRDAGTVTLADDSGLEVTALGGAPGLHSARYHPRPGASDADRRQYLLQMLQGKPQPWKAHFHCTVAIADHQGRVWYASGDCPGEIIPEERGSGGFGYDPIFLLTELGQTMAELSEEHKNQISHRARALKAALPILEKLAGQQG